MSGPGQIQQPLATRAIRGAKHSEHDYTHVPVLSSVLLPWRGKHIGSPAEIGSYFMENTPGPCQTHTQNETAPSQARSFHSQSLAPATFTTLPAELQIKVFTNLLSPYNTSYTRSILHQRTALLLLTRQIYNLVMASPTLWAHISVSGPVVNHSMTRRSLELAKGTGLWWVFDFRSDNDEPSDGSVRLDWCTPDTVGSILDMYLLPTLAQTTHLHILVHSSILFPSIFSTFSHSPASILKEFKIITGQMIYPLMSMHARVNPLFSSPGFEVPANAMVNLFGGGTLRFSSLQLHSVPAQYLHALFKRINNAQATKDLAHTAIRPGIAIQHLDLSMQRAIIPATFYGILGAVSPSLKSLALRNTGPASNYSMIPFFPFNLYTDLTNSLEYIAGNSWQGNDLHLSNDGGEIDTLSAYSVTLPALTRLIIGGMTAEYLGVLLSTLSFHPLSFLGIHGVRVRECEATWKILSTYTSPTLSQGYRTQGLPEEERARAFGSLETLELFDLEPSPQMGEVLSQDKEDVAENTISTAFHGFLMGLSTVTELRMRRVASEFATALGGPYIDQLYTSSAPTNLFPLPALERLELCCLTHVSYDLEEGDYDNPWILDYAFEDLLPLKAQEVAEIVVTILHSRIRYAQAASGSLLTAGGIRRLHFDGDEWPVRSSHREELLQRIALLYNGRSHSFDELVDETTPIIHWDARAPFFADYYDSTEI